MPIKRIDNRTRFNLRKVNDVKAKIKHRLKAILLPTRLKFSFSDAIKDKKIIRKDENKRL